MENADFLKYFIQEDVYQIDEEISIKEQAGETEKTSLLSSDIKQSTNEEQQVEAGTSQPVPPVYKPTNDVLILVRDAHHDVLAEDQLAYLEKILGAVNLSKEMVDMVNGHRWKSIPFAAYKKIICFAPDFDLPFDRAEKYTFKSWERSQVAIADPVSAISASVELRKLLWGCLKSGFGIS